MTIVSATITCPHCGTQAVETMPVDACQHFYRCGGCDVILIPRPGDCCVFCSFGDVRCPPMQDELRDHSEDGAGA